MIDKSYQDVGFYADFRCSGECAAGVLLRAEKTPEGMKGVYVALTGDPGAYKVMLDSQGQEVETRETAAGGRNHSLRARQPTLRPAGGGGGRGRGAPAMRRTTGIPSRSCWIRTSSEWL